MKNLFILLFILVSLNVFSQNPLRERVNQNLNERLGNLFKSEIKENRQWRKENPRPRPTYGYNPYRIMPGYYGYVYNTSIYIPGGYYGRTYIYPKTIRILAY